MSVNYKAIRHDGPRRRFSIFTYMKLYVCTPQPKYQQFDGCQNRQRSLTLSHYLFLSLFSVGMANSNGLILANENKKSSAIPHQKQKDVFVLCLPGGTAMPCHARLMRFFALMCTMHSNSSSSSSTHARSECFMVFPLFAVVIFIVVCFFN